MRIKILFLRLEPNSLVTSQHLGHTLETHTLRTTSFNLLSVFKQLKQVPFFSLVERCKHLHLERGTF